MKSIFDDSFRYTRSTDTDLRKTFARIRREQRQQARAQVQSDDPRKVFPIRQRKPAVASWTVKVSRTPHRGQQRS